MLLDEIWTKIISLLNFEDIISINQCSKYFHNLCKSKNLREKLFQRFTNDTLFFR